MFVFVDETWTDRRDALRKFGYSLRGKRATSQKLLVRGQRVSAVGYYLPRECWIAILLLGQLMLTDLKSLLSNPFYPT